MARPVALHVRVADWHVCVRANRNHSVCSAVSVPCTLPPPSHPKNMQARTQWLHSPGQQADLNRLGRPDPRRPAAAAAAAILPASKQLAVGGRAPSRPPCSCRTGGERTAGWCGTRVDVPAVCRRSFARGDQRLLATIKFGDHPSQYWLSMTLQRPDCFISSPPPTHTHPGTYTHTDPSLQLRPIPAPRGAG